MPNHYPKINQLEQEELNTLSNFYIGDVYRVEVNANVKVIFKFFVSFPESFHTQDINLKEKEKEQISKYLSLKSIENGKTYTFEFKYSDFFEVDPKVL